jgi:hypothetical protein
MKSSEFITELRKKKVKEPVVQSTPYDHAYDHLMWMIEDGEGKRPANTYQLFMPRRHPGAMTKYDKHLKNVGTSWAYEKDSPEIKQSYQDWADKEPFAPTKLGEAAPVLFQGQAPVPPGNNKPTGAFWTSTARRLNNNTYTSDWVRWVSGNQPDWMAPTGYLYKVGPQVKVLGMDGDHTAEEVYRTFNSLGRGNDAYYTHDEGGYNDLEYKLKKDFPWPEVAKHFDCVTHSGYSSDHYGFTYGWDCESTGWFNTKALTLVGEVKINQNGLDPFDMDDE